MIVLAIAGGVLAGVVGTLFVVWRILTKGFNW